MAMPQPNSPSVPFVFAVPEWLDEIDSTNDDLKRRLAADQNLPSGTVIAARRQTRGRGRLGNGWIGSPDRDLAFSFVWKGCAAVDRIGTLPMACALGVRDFLLSLAPKQDIFCKWPNDVLVGDAKICGILAETSAPASTAGVGNGVGNGVDNANGLASGIEKATAKANGIRCLVVGIGVNLRRDDERDASVARAVASVEEATGQTLSPEQALALLLPFLAARIAVWQARGFAALHEAFTRCLWGMNRPMTARTAQGPVAGLLHGVGENGELLLARPDAPPLRVASVAALEP